jgi:hypothetical protein
MSQFYDLASLVVIPSGYKASTIYAQKPLTTDGQLSFSRASTATRVNASGLIEAVASNVPRLDYLGSSCPRLLLEPQRTNVVTYSEQINNAAWGKLNTTISANAAVAPDGTTSADLVYPTTTGTDRVIEQLPVGIIGQTWTSSFFVKASGFSWVLIYSPNLVTCWFNASTGTFGTVGAGATATVLGQVNGFWRVSFTGTIASSNAYLYVGTADANGTTTSTASGTNGILIWGCQIELGAYATSYIPTLAASVTRVADAASKTGISSLIGQTEGTLFAEIFVPSIATAGTFANFTLSDGTSSNLVTIAYYPDGRIQAAAIVGGSLTVNIDLTSYGLTAGTHKFAFAYKLNDYVFYVDGVQQGTDTSSGVPAMSKFDLFDAIGATLNYNQALLFKTRLTNAQLAELTAL